MYLLDLATLDTNLITNDALGNPGGIDFDGTQWLVWLDLSDGDVNWLWKYDVLNGVGPTVAQNGMTEIMAPKIFDGIVYYSAWDNPMDMVNRADPRTHDLSTGVNEWMFESPWDQVQVTTAGRVMAYADTETLAHTWFSDPTAQIELYDLDTHVTRQLTEVAAEYYGLARHDKYLGYLLGDDWLILCDLEAGGFIDSSGHVCPESGCPEPDGGVDGGKK
jgi:hypothetical protein